MAGSPYIVPIASASSGGGTTPASRIQISGSREGSGAIFGGPAGLIQREFILGAGLYAQDLDGKLANPYINARESICAIATQTINAASTTPTLLVIRGGMDECELTTLSFRRFSAVPPATMKGRLYAALPVTGGDWIDEAAVMDEMTFGTVTGLSVKNAPPYPQLRKLTALWYRPLVPGPAGLTFEIQVRGMPRWRENQAKPYTP